MYQKQFFLVPLIFVSLLMSCQSISNNRSVRPHKGQVESVINKNNFELDLIADLDEDPEDNTLSEGQNGLDEETIFSDTQNVLGADEPLIEPDEEPSQICEDSIYYSSWKAQFDKTWLEQNKNKYRNARSRQAALTKARSDAYLQLAYSSLNNTSYDFPIVINRQVASWIDYFTGKGRRPFVVWLRRAQELNPKLSYILEKNGLPKDLVYLAMIESGLNNRAVSWVGAGGPWQFMPSTAKLYGLTINDWIDERRDPIKSTHAASKYLTDLYTRFGSWHLAAGAYNCGEGCISRKLRQYGKDKSYFYLTSRGLINRQTANYVPKIIAAMIIAKNPDKFGFETKNHKYNFTTVRTITVDRSIALTDLAHSINIDPKVLADLNPALRLGITPPRHALISDGFAVIIPNSVYGKAVAAISTLPDVPQNRIVQAKIPYRQTIHNFAKKYNLSVSDICRVNKGFAKRKYLNRGEMIHVPVMLGTGQYDKLLSYKKPKKKYTKRKYTRYKRVNAKSKTSSLKRRGQAKK